MEGIFRFAARFWRLGLDLALVGLLAAVLAGAWVVRYILPGLPDIGVLADVRLQVPLRVYSRDGSLIGEFGEKRRIPLTLDEVPESMIHAVLAAEDHRFFQHSGVDWKGLTRAALHHIVTGDRSQGGSTLTMQLARNFFLSREKTYLRKANEIFLALKMERELSKERLLELYLNKVFFGHRAYGAAAAAEVYYGSPRLDRLSVAQIAMIAGLPQRPSHNNPISNPERAIRRRNYVLYRMRELGYLDEERYRQAVEAPVTARLHRLRPALEASYAAAAVRTRMLKEYGEEALTGGYRVYTTVDDRLQRMANQALRKALLAYSHRHGYRGPEHRYSLQGVTKEADWERLLGNHRALGGTYPALVVHVGDRALDVWLEGIGPISVAWPGLSWARPYLDPDRQGPSPERAEDIALPGDVVRIYEDEQGQWRLTQLPALEGGLVAMRPDDGTTLAMVGGFDFRRSKFNRVLQARRQPGSGFKPFLYSAGLEAGFTAASLLNDAPLVYEGLGPQGEDWRPRNYTRKTYGPTRLREALVHSRNLVSVRLLDAIGIPFARAYLSRFGFSPERLPDNLSLALGSGELTPWEMARGYSVFANGGYQVDPYLIERIELEGGETIFQAAPRRVCRQEECLAIERAGTAGAGLRVTPRKEGDERAPRVLEARNAWLTASMTYDVIQRGTGIRARALGRKDLSGKTGTTNDQRDAWFSGFNRDLVAVCWVGFDDFRPLGRGETGARAALPMWIEFMDKALAGQPERPLPRPPGLVNVRIDPDSGSFAQRGSRDSFNEVFRREYAPAESIDTGISHLSGTDEAKRPRREELF